MIDIKKLLADYRDIQARIGGCNDDYCCIERRRDMHLNGGCLCLRRMDNLQSQRVAQLLRCAQEMAKALEKMENEQ